MRALALSIAAALAVVACSPATAPQPSGSPPVVALRYRCEVFPFDANLVDPSRHDEEANTPIAAELRRYLATPAEDAAILPDHGWTLAGSSATAAEFVTHASGDGFDFRQVSLEFRSYGGWRTVASGYCRPQIVMPPGIGNASWRWSDNGRPGPDTERFTALVFGWECASGRSPEGRILPPAVFASATQVLVVFGVTSLTGVQTCQGTPPAPALVDLGAPLGNRQLLDAGLLPYREATQPVSPFE